jgi:hypothetical protein
MTALVFFIEQTAVGLYILVGLGILLTFRRWTRIRYDLRSTHFELEREIYRYRIANTFTLLILLIEAGLVVFGVQQVVAPTIRNTGNTSVALDQVVEDGIVLSPTPAPVEFGSSPIDASGVQIGEEEILQVIATPTLTPTPVGTIMPNPPPVSGCDTPNATLQVPANGMLVFEPITVIGTAFTDNFSSYKFELKSPVDTPPTYGQFATIGSYVQPIATTSELGQFVPAFYPPGEYQFRVTVFDINSELKAACTVNITISEPIPTATPFQQ